MLHTLYLLFIAPLEFLLRLVLEWGFALTHSWGWALVLLSLAVNTAMLPISNWAERQREKERELRRIMARHEAMLRDCFKGQERFALLTALRRLSGYNWRFSLRASVGLMLQIPFFIAAYHLLSGFGPLHGQSFGPLPNLGVPDGLLSGVNLLPFVMTAANLVAAFVYARDLSRRDKFQIYGIALLFLALLYAAPSALVLYWTLNNVYSLCKNLVEKLWLRHPVWQAFRAICRSGAHPIDGKETFRTRLLEAVRCSSVVGAVFWLYTCAQALMQRHEALDAGFKTAIRHLAGQCILTALSASFVLAIFSPSLFRLKPKRRVLLLLASFGILFLCHFGMFKGNFAIEQGRFPFGMWDSAAGRLCFALWGLGIFCIGRFYDKLAGMLAGLSNGLLICLNLRSVEGERRSEEEAEAPHPSSRDTFILACLMGLVCGLFLWYFIPFCSYFRNTNEFDFNGIELFWKVTPYCFATVLATSLFFFATTYFLPFECIKLPWKRAEKCGAKITASHTITLFILLAFLIEGTILSYNLPKLAGQDNMFAAKYRLIIDTVIWCSLILVGIFGIKEISNNFFKFISILIIFSSTALCDFFIESEEKIDTSKFNANQHMCIIDDEELFSSIQFSKNHNIIIIVVDSLDSLSFEKTLEIYPELKQIFKGFYFFRENLGPGGLTYYAIPQILSGNIYDGRESMFELTQNALVGQDNIGVDASVHGAKVFIHTGGLCAITKKDKIKDKIIHNKNIDIKSYINLLTFKFFPYFTKHLFAEMVNVKNHVIDSRGIIGTDVNKQEFRRVISRMKFTCDEDVLLFVHFFGVHLPFIKEDIIKTTKEFFNDFSSFQNELKYHQLYDNSTIIVMADHGLYSKDYRSWYPDRNGTQPTAMFPLLMIKTPTSNQEMIIREDLTSSVYVRYILQHFYKYGATNTTMDNYLDGLSKVRFVYKPGEGKYEAIGTFSTMKLKKATN